MIVGEKSWSNIIIIKEIMKLFEMMLGLKVNFQKSSQTGINIPPVWITKVARILNCKICEFPFNYLGILIGENPKRKETWKKVVETVKYRLLRWKNKHLSFRGRVVLLKYVLYAISDYYLSFFEAPTGIISKLESISKQFLWGGNKEERKIYWVNWDKVCRSIVEGGLELKI